MALSDPILWQRLGAFEVSPPEAVFSFAKRLAQENRWPLEHARAAFAEYRRFLYLRMIAGRAMTPSDAVDRVWHLHLTYPRSYGQELCRNLLGRPLHHEPTRGGPAGRARIEDAYRATIAVYQREFGITAPDLIWPDPPGGLERTNAIHRS